MSTSPRRTRVFPAALAALTLTAGVAVIGVTAPPPARADSSAVTVNREDGGTVTVEQTTGLVNQVVRVSWTGFRPSRDSGGNLPEPGAGVPVGSSAVYPVRVFQCRGTDPTIQDCYGAFGNDPSRAYTFPGQQNYTDVIPDGPGNARTSSTNLDGVGEAEIEVRTARESSTLGCSAQRQCSLVVVPNYGLDPANPDPFGLDPIFATAQLLDSLPEAWDLRSVIPVVFAQSGDVCDLTRPDVSLVGSQLIQRAVNRWQPGICNAAVPVDAAYVGLGEPEALRLFAARTANLAITSRPLPAELASARPHTYAPLAVSGVAVAFQAGDVDTGERLRRMRLNARLVAKLLTLSYGYSGRSQPGADYGNPSVRGNPGTIWEDPEFRALNPESTGWWGSEPPIIATGSRDVTYELTRWVAADAEARAFLAGTADPYGMRVNARYRGVQYPTELIVSQDDYEPLTYQFRQVGGLDEAAQFLVNLQPSGRNDNRDSPGCISDNLNCETKKDPYQYPSQGLIAFVSTADAAAFRFPVAELRNAAGAYVAPTVTSMDAGVKAMTVNADKVTRSPNFASTDPAAYPLTMVQYGVAPTAGLKTGPAGKIADFFEYAAGPGQLYGTAPGDLPEGYLALPPALRTQLTAAAAAVRDQVDTLPPATAPDPTDPPGAPGGGNTGGDGNGGDQGGGSGDGGGAGGGGTPPTPPATTAPAAAPSATATPTDLPAASARPVSSAGAGWVRWILPIVLMVGLVAAVAGPTLVSGRNGPLGRFGSRLRGFRIRG